MSTSSARATIRRIPEVPAAPHRRSGPCLWLFRGACLAMALGGRPHAATAAPSEDRGQLELARWRYTTRAYKEAALDVLLQEVNRVAHDMQLPEKLPIERADLVETHVAAPFWSEHVGGFGSITTRNYDYSASVGNKLSYIVRNLGPSDQREQAYNNSLKARYLAPINQMDTNAAHAMATQFLASAGVDVLALERDYRKEILAWEVGDKFVPVYSIRWHQPYDITSGPPAPAFVQLLAPERRLLQMHVESEKHLRRKRLVVPNRDRLLQQTEDPQMRQMWLTTEAYKQAALLVMLEEVNRICRALTLPERLPVRVSDLRKVIIETPFVSDHIGHFGTVRTDNYAYGAEAYKLVHVTRATSEEQQRADREVFRKRYSVPEAQLNTNAAYRLATQWLAAASVDVAALERDYQVQIRPWDWHPNQGSRGRFTPLYELRWERTVGRLLERAVYMEVLEPERQLETLRVEKPEYITRPPFTVPDRDRLLSQTNAPPGEAGTH